MNNLLLIARILFFLFENFISRKGILNEKMPKTYYTQNVKLTAYNKKALPGTLYVIGTWTVPTKQE